MKRKKTLVVITALMSIMTVASILSCDSDDFWGFDSDEGNYSEYSNQAFLDLSDYSNLSNLSEHDKLILQEAEERMNVQCINGLFGIKYNNGSEINISDRLFNYIANNYNHLNSLLKNNNKVRRIKRNSPESVNPYEGQDCVPIAISHYCGVSYEDAIKGLAGKHLTLIEAVRIFKSNAVECEKLKLSSTGGILVLYEHVVNLEKVEKATYDGKKGYRVYYKDWQQYGSNGGDGLYVLIRNLKFPCKNIYGVVDMIYGLVQ